MKNILFILLGILIGLVIMYIFVNDTYILTIKNQNQGDESFISSVFRGNLND